MIKVNEIFHSIQGESTFAGKPCVFVRLTYCNLRCSYCDTEYSFYEGRDYSIAEVVEKVKSFNCNLVEITGGEPLVQKESLTLMDSLIENKFEVLLETGGSLTISDVNPRVKIIMDLKCPSSNMEKKNDYSNIAHLKSNDEVKFVIGDRLDYEWTKEIISKYKLTEKCTVLVSTIFNILKPVELAEWILEDGLDVVFQLQMHKFIWEPERRGV